MVTVQHGIFIQPSTYIQLKKKTQGEVTPEERNSSYFRKLGAPALTKILKHPLNCGALTYSGHTVSVPQSRAKGVKCYAI